MESHNTSTPPTTNQDQQSTERDTVCAYRTPRIIELGEATDLMRRDGTGHLIDGTGGWWVWGS